MFNTLRVTPVKAIIPPLKHYLVTAIARISYFLNVCDCRRAMSAKCGFQIVIPMTVVAMLGLLVVYKLVPSRRSVVSTQARYGGEPWKPSISSRDYAFEPVMGRGVFSFQNTCIEVCEAPDTETTVAVLRNVSYKITNQIVVYNSKFNSEYRQFLVGASPNVKRAHWRLNFTKKSVPSDHMFVNRTAFFIHPTCPGNFHHFWEDEFVMLFSVIQQTRKLRPGADNQVIYRYPWDIVPEELDCYDVRTYENILKTLHIHPVHDWFSYLRPPICFSQAVFGLANHKISKSREAVDYVMEQLGPDRSSCNGEVVTIVQRTHRKIMNTQELIESLYKAGYVDVQIVQFENLTVQEQLRTAGCNSTLIGVQGAGLRWGTFMLPGSMLVEIAWPKAFWNHYYRFVAHKYGLRYLPLEARTVRPNWQTYEDKLRGGIEVSDDEKKVLLTAVPKSVSADNIWKWADVTVDVHMLVQELNTTKMKKS